MIVIPEVRKLTTHSVLYERGAYKDAVQGDPVEAARRAQRWRRLAAADALDSHRPAALARAGWWQSIADASARVRSS
jgi:hypothetical protein